jgi:anthranilate synthase component 1
MLPENGPIVAASDVTPEAWLSSLPPDSTPLVLAPGSSRGWFDGRAVVAWSPELTAVDLTIEEATSELEHVFSADAPALCAVLLPYAGSATMARYAGGLVHTPEGWRVWGTLGANDVPEPGATSCTLPADVPLGGALVSDLGEAEYRAAVESVREAVMAGDVYVLNLTRRLSGNPTVSPRTAFASLVDRTHADMAALLEVGDTAIASASPERFLRVLGDRVEVCPIKGTRPRAAGAADIALAAELASSEKERAEHVMIVDLERNDLGRVCQPGTVLVDPLFEVIATPYCHQMVSTVSGQMAPGATLGDLMVAAFPCGSVTGAPKLAAMRKIAALELSSRAAYTGALVVAVPGALDSSVLIRTAEYADGAVQWGTGAGITVDSDAGEEWLETILKASPFLGTSGAGYGDARCD